MLFNNMGRGSTQILIRKIVESLAKGPKSITEIAEETGLDRTAIARYLNLLKESGFLKEEEKGTSKIFHISSTYRLDTYFGLPIDDKTNKLIDSLYYLIKKKWKEKTQRKLLKTTAQKILYEVIQKANLKIPHGWYIYGGIPIKPYDYYTAYTFSGLDENVVAVVDSAVTDYDHKFAYESKQHQYRDAKKEVYDVKEEILRLLYSKNFSKNSMFVFQKLYSKFIRLIPKGDKIYDELINDYMTLIIDITRKWDDFVDEKDDRNFAEFKQKLISSFEALWRLVALFNFKKDLFEGKFYPRIVLDEHFKLNIEQAKEELIEIGSELNEMIPFEEPDDPVYRKIKEALRKANKPVSKEELREQNEELEKIKREKGLKAFQEELRKRVGLE